MSTVGDARCNNSFSLVRSASKVEGLGWEHVRRGGPALALGIIQTKGSRSVGVSSLQRVLGSFTSSARVFGKSR